MAEISVIIPAYNQAAYLAEAIQSVYDQTFTDWELVVVDDGSTDDTPRLLAGFQDSRMSVVRQANRGRSAARNTGICLTSAPLVSFLDADDLFLPDKMTELHRYLNDHPEVGLAVGGMQRVDSLGRTYEEKTITPTRLDFPGLLLGDDIQLGGVMIRREWLERVGGFDESMHTCEDWDLWLRLVVAGCQLSRVEKVVMAYRIHSGQVTGDVATMRIGTLGLWEKFFSLPNLPSDLLAYRSLAVASALVRTSARAFRSGDFETGNRDLAEAIKLDPSLSGAGYRKLADLLRGWAADPRTQDPEAYLISISKHLPSSLCGLRRQLRQAAASMILESCFGASRTIWRSRRRALIKALYHDPSWLTNRGVVRMLVEAWFPVARKRS
jgi:glycosyltransferase involved in cell wall biosynthesis